MLTQLPTDVHPKRPGFKYSLLSLSAFSKPLSISNWGVAHFEVVTTFCMTAGESEIYFSFYLKLSSRTKVSYQICLYFWFSIEFYFSIQG